MLRRKDDEAPAREVSLWLKRNGILERYKNLRSHNKVVLRNLVCIPTRPTTYSQRKDLYKKLCLPEGKDSIGPVDSTTDEQRKKFFTPLAPSETLSYLEGF